MSDEYETSRTPDWQSRGATDAKRDEMEKRWENGIPPVVWYDLGDRFGADGVLPPAIVQRIFADFYPGFAQMGVQPDLSTHASRVLPGHMLLRIRNPIQYPYFPTIAGRICPLYQAGGQEEVSETNDSAVNFATLWRTT